MKYKNIIFDLYGTLADVWTDEKRKSVWDSLAWYFGLYQAYYSSKELKKAYFEEEKKQLKQRRKELGEHAEIDVISIFFLLFSVFQCFISTRVFSIFNVEYNYIALVNHGTIAIV